MNTTTADARSATVTDQPGAGQLRRSADGEDESIAAAWLARRQNRSR